MNATNAILLIAATGVVLTVIKWAFLAERRLPRNRVRHMRIRLRLRLHPGKGQATVGELWWRWGRLAAFRHSRRTRPTFTFSDRLLAPAPEQSVLVGRAHYRHALRLPLDEHAAIFSPPRGGKTGWLARVLLRYPGPVLSTTTKHDVYALTAAVRAARGPVHVLNPQGVGSVASTFRWNPLDGCEDPAVAIRRADAFANSVSQAGVENSSFWAAKASDYLRAFSMRPPSPGWTCGTSLAGSPAPTKAKPKPSWLPTRPPPPTWPISWLRCAATPIRPSRPSA
jgi:type IV secretion system protein VirD4